MGKKNQAIRPSYLVRNVAMLAVFSQGGRVPQSQVFGKDFEAYSSALLTIVKELEDCGLKFSAMKVQDLRKECKFRGLVPKKGAHKVDIANMIVSDCCASLS